MSEIKSTIEIIMEKLDKIGISEKDKKEIIKREAEDLAKRLIARYMERLAIQEILNELKLLKTEKQNETKKALIHECLKRISPYGEHNEDIFELLQMLLNKKIDFLKKMVNSVEDNLNREKEKYTKHLLEKLKERGIYGTAVIPNIEADPKWKQKIKEANDKLYSDLNNFISKLE